MSNDRAATGCNTDIAATTDKMIERKANAVPATVAIPTVRPWTSDFLLPSIRFHEPKRT
jgi:hypothetical protein